MGWLSRWDARNQRIVGRQLASGPESAESDDDGAGQVVGSYASYLPGIVGLLGVVVASLAAWRRTRRQPRT